MPHKPIVVSIDLQSEELSVTEMADKLGLNVSTIRAWIHQNRIPARKRGRGWVLREADVLKLLEDHPSLGKAHRPREGHLRRPRTHEYDYEIGGLQPRKHLTHSLRDGLGL
jgi:excisionase family DNA binding protein